MDTIIFTNILFTALSAFLICLTVGFVVFVVCAVMLFKNVYKLFTIINTEAQKVTDDIDKVRDSVQKGKESVENFLHYLLVFLKPRKKKGSGSSEK